MKITKMKITNQHGDCIFVKCDLPEGKFKKAKKGFIIERGEGVHVHQLIEGDMDIWVDVQGNMFLRANTQCTIDHEEHGKQVIEIGTYKKIIEREWDYESEEARKTQD